jgi:ATP-binding cassette, subfamily F, member 3
VLLQLSSVSKSYGAQTVLRDVTFQINPGEKTGLIGTNGSGKTTLLKILSTTVEPDDGVVSRRSGLITGTLEQIPDFHERTTVLEEALRSFANLIATEKELAALEHEIAGHADPVLLDRYATLQHEFEHKGGYRFRSMAEAAVLGIGFTRPMLTRETRALSGGEKNRLALAKLLLSEADLLLLDEPTNHLDIRSIEWLEKFLKDTAKTVIVVSHDRIFLDRVVNRILEVDNSRLSDYPGNYSDYVRGRAERLAQQEKEWNLQKRWIENQEDYIRRNLAGQKTKQAKSRRNLLARVHRLERPKASSEKVKFNFLPVDRGSRHVLRTEELTIGYDKPLIQNLQFQVERGERWAILGANGSGKTTLLRTLTGEVSPMSGGMEWSENLELGYYDQQLSGLDPASTILEEIRSLDMKPTDGELRSYLAMFLFSGEDIFKKVESLSGGEKSRLALAKLIYEGPALLALDEPTNHLDIVSREALESALLEYPGTILFVTHDRYLAKKIATHLMYIEGQKAYTFDRLSAFEEWLVEGKTEGKLEGKPVAQPAAEAAAAAPRTSGQAGQATAMSKNRRDKLQNEVKQIEENISRLEAELKNLEEGFANPDPTLNWEAAHRRHAAIREELETLYATLADQWEQMGL